ncbi:DUF4407 domain-containing protein [Frankia tisae]|uniref:DUF4407 domain-containing protein n=1 Tax=Frankia tisae TaxID=2950104 RepID=UPI0021C1A5AF|nr:DUF4407 domain-containing protein [Frankia tisae]
MSDPTASRPAEDALPQVRRASPPTRVLLWCAGVDPTKLGSIRLRLLYSAYGLFLLLVAILAATSFTVFGSVVVGHFNPLLLPFGLLWAMFIFAADRVIVMEPKRPRSHRSERRRRGRAGRRGAGDDTVLVTGLLAPDRSPGAAAEAAANRPAAAAPPGAPDLPDNTGPAAGWRPVPPDLDPAPSRVSTLAKYALRFTLAVLAALLVSEALLLIIFAPEVNQKLADTHHTLIQDKREQLRAEELAPLQAKLASLDTRIGADQPVVDGLFTQVTDQGAHITPAEEFLPTGKAYHLLVSDYNTRNDALQAEIRERNTTDRSVQGLTAKPLPAAPADFLAKVARSDGFLARHAALNQIVHENRSLAQWLWIIRGTLLAFDLLPLVIKMLARPSPYDEAIALQDAALSEHNATMFDARRYATALEASVARAGMRAWHTTELDYIDFVERNGVRSLEWRARRPPGAGKGNS